MLSLDKVSQVESVFDILKSGAIVFISEKQRFYRCFLKHGYDSLSKIGSLSTVVG